MMYAKGIMLVSAWLLCSPLGSLGAVELQHAGETRLQTLRHKCSITQSCRKFVLSLGMKLPLFLSSALFGFQLRSLNPCLQEPWAQSHARRVIFQQPGACMACLVAIMHASHYRACAESGEHSQCSG